MYVCTAVMHCDLFLRAKIKKESFSEFDMWSMIARKKTRPLSTLNWKGNFATLGGKAAETISSSSGIYVSL